MTELPKKNISCPDILPLAHSSHVPDRSAMSKTGRLMHPDALNDRRYISGTRLQMQKKKTSHKKLSCSFHDLDNTEEGKLVNSMNQEALQVTRKAKTIQQDRMRGFSTSFLANFLQDYFHNLKKAKDQEKRFKKMDGFVEIQRDSLTGRAIVIDNKEASDGGNKRKKLS